MIYVQNKGGGSCGIPSLLKNDYPFPIRLVVPLSFPLPLTGDANSLVFGSQVQSVPSIDLKPVVQPPTRFEILLKGKHHTSKDVYLSASKVA